jgi:glycosyltransferase involved in cell wall biosynthesis
MEKFSVIIPTIWNGTKLPQLLKNLYECEQVGEVILINNAKDKTPDFERHEKLLYVEPNQNIFVNPAWNMGTRLAKYDYIINTQDDLVFDVDNLTKFINYADSVGHSLKNLGIIGMHLDNFYMEPDTQPELELINFDNSKGGGWACCLIYHRSNWVQVPEGIKIYYGDNFLQMAVKPILQIKGFPVETKMSSSADTSVEWVKAVTDNDLIEWHKILAEWKNYQSV